MKWGCLMICNLKVNLKVIPYITTSFLILIKRSKGSKKISGTAIRNNSICLWRPKKTLQFNNNGGLYNGGYNVSSDRKAIL